tara:strand:+ start:563 stop:1180 length:618 start_codon:yes stop_codon:yes gene_type:complete
MKTNAPTPPRFPPLRAPLVRVVLLAVVLVVVVVVVVVVVIVRVVVVVVVVSVLRVVVGGVVISDERYLTSAASSYGLFFHWSTKPYTQSPRRKKIPSGNGLVSSSGFKVALLWQKKKGEKTRDIKIHRGENVQLERNKERERERAGSGRDDVNARRRARKTFSLWFEEGKAPPPQKKAKRALRGKTFDEVTWRPNKRVSVVWLIT